MGLYITYKNTKIHYTASGKGTTVVLLHGFLENVHMWKNLEQLLVSKYRVVCIDLLGHGKSDNLGYVHTMTQMAEVVKAVLEELNVRRSFFIGHSMGGYVSLAFADLYPDNVKGLILLNSTARTDTNEKKTGRDRAIAVVKENHKSFIRTSIPMLFRSKCRKIYAKEIAEVKKQALTTSRQGIIAALEGMKIRLDREVLLHFGPYPSLMILGKKDPVLNYEDLIEQTKDSKTSVVELENGHMSLIEDRLDAESAILSFIRKN
ncbi:alpha/beta fold hydrolase [Wenyingzhuangia sp. IMCC45533]